MRKSLLTLALALAFPSVFAQSRGPEADESLARGPSRVEIYGIVDVGLEHQDVGDVSATRISSGISAGTRIGVRGTEEIGRGMRAVFALESRVEADTGSVTNRGPLFYCQFPNSTVISCPGITLTVPVTPALAPIVLGGVNAVNQQLLQAVTTVNSAGALFDRQAFAGLITPVGAFLLGRQYTPGYEVMNRFSAFADSTSGQIGQGYANLAIRSNNAIQYRAELAGFTFAAMYGFGGTEVNRSERTTGPGKGDDFMGLNLMYLTPMFSVGAGYNRNNTVTLGQPAESQTGLETTNVGGTFTLGTVKVFAQYMQRKNDNPVITQTDLQNLILSTGGNQAAIASILGGLYINAFDVDGMRGLPGKVDTKIYHLGVTWDVGPGRFYAAYNDATDKANDVWDTEDAKVRHMAIAYFYNLSRRSQLYAVYALANNSGSSRMALGAAGYAGGFTTARGEDASAIQLGMRHAF
jgi:GBP family porin